LRVEARGVEKRFGRAYVLKGVDLDVESGGLSCLLGPSGSGKTTVLRIIAMLESQDSGEITYDGRPGDNGVCERMVMVLQKPVVFKRTVFENVAYGLRIRDIEPENIEERVAGALDVVNLDGFEERWAPSLSGGEQQRVAFARAIVLEPALLLLDEFTANLDPAHVKVLEKAVQRYREKGGSTVLMASHDLFLVKRMKPKVMFLSEGKVIETADADRFLSNPGSEEAGRFIRGEL
jgi:tungstate transport system ATP-binding protein